MGLGTNFEVQPAQFGRGLNLVAAPELMQEGQCRVLQNWRTLGSGRASTRRAARLWADGSEPVLAIHPYSALPGVAGIRLTFAQTGSAPVVGNVHLWTLDANGNATLVGTLAGWANVKPTVRVHVASLNTAVFIVDEGKVHGLTIWDPLDTQGSGEDLFQPTFVFDDTESPEPAPLRANYICEHLNHLWVFGYGSESDPDRPELARFSYLGLLADGLEDGWDAGAEPGCALGSANLFDATDTIPVISRGERIAQGVSAPGRLLIGSERESYVIYGSDRDSWRRDKVDSQRGFVNSKAGGEADGAGYGMSHLGPWRYRGGGIMDDITEAPDGASIRPLLREMDCESLFFAHAFDEGQVRWYYRRISDLLQGCDRFVGWDYRAGTWIQDVLGGGMRVTCAGHIRPSILEPPVGAPSGLSHINVTSRSATAVWTPGDASPGVRTLVYLQEGSGPFRQVAELESGATRYTHTGLLPTPAGGPPRTYTTKIIEIRNGVSLGELTDSFVTLTQGTVLLPTHISAVNQAYQVGSEWFPGVALRWVWASEAFTLVIEKSDDEAGPFEELVASSSTFYHDIAVVAGTIAWYRFKSRNSAGDETGYTLPVAVPVTLRTTDPIPPGFGDESGGEQEPETEVPVDEE